MLQIRNTTASLLSLVVDTRNLAMGLGVQSVPSVLVEQGAVLKAHSIVFGDSALLALRSAHISCRNFWLGSGAALAGTGFISASVNVTLGLQSIVSPGIMPLLGCSVCWPDWIVDDSGFFYGDLSFVTPVTLAAASFLNKKIVVDANLNLKCYRDDSPDTWAMLWYLMDCYEWRMAFQWLWLERMDHCCQMIQLQLVTFCGIP